jgi:eukaryotic-like serine/threonine-protein kinase
MDPHWFVVDWDRCLGGGGEGEVFLARSLETGELCAVKVSTSLDAAIAREQLAKELERSSRASGQGVVDLVAWNLDVPRPFLVFEFARAGTLADEMSSLRKQGRVYHPVGALRRIRSVLAVLGAVHSRGLVHRDVKPANLLRFGESIKLGDFGSGRSIDRSSTLQTEGFVGTRAYASPEQLRGEPVDERADLYAAGCILYEMLTGELPSLQRVTRPAGYATALVLPELDALLGRLLAEDATRRPRSARAAMARVDAVMASYAAARRAWSDLGLGPSPY